MTTMQPVRQAGAPGQELLTPKQPAGEHAIMRVHGMTLDHPLGQIDPYANGTVSDNLRRGLPLSRLQIDDSHYQSWRFDAVA
jgi:hypothetical protein